MALLLLSGCRGIHDDWKMIVFWKMRLVTYNVRHCRGADGRVSPGRIARVLQALDPDIVALQEVDVGQRRTGGEHQPKIIADHLRMDLIFQASLGQPQEGYGNALLSRFPMEQVRAECLPGQAGCESRGAIWARVHAQGISVQILTTHLGLHPAERQLQMGTLLGWLAETECQAPRILCGDLNSWPGSKVYRAARAVLRDAQEEKPHGWPRNTFPARLPLLRIDHIFLSPDLAVLAVQVPRDALTRIASDHLPLLAEVTRQ